jgi:hypothetical protein
MTNDSTSIAQLTKLPGYSTSDLKMATSSQLCTTLVDAENTDGYWLLLNYGKKEVPHSLIRFKPISQQNFSPIDTPCSSTQFIWTSITPC